jgi:hypothetical protein
MAEVLPDRGTSCLNSNWVCEGYYAVCLLKHFAPIFPRDAHHLVARLVGSAAQQLLTKRFSGEAAVMFSVWEGFLWALAQELRVAHCY